MSLDFDKDLNSKFTSKDYLKKYVKNNKTVAMFDADANVEDAFRKYDW